MAQVVGSGNAATAASMKRANTVDASVSVSVDRVIAISGYQLIHTMMA